MPGICTCLTEEHAEVCFETRAVPGTDMQSPYITIGKPTIVVIPEYKVVWTSWRD
jgi:hypothetical protein